MWAAQPKTEVHPVFLVLFSIAWLSIMSSFLWSGAFVVPRALDRWATRQKFKVIKKAQAGLIRRMSSGASSSQTLFQVVVQDPGGKTYSGLVMLGSYWWPSLTVDRCPVVVVQWDGIPPAKSYLGKDKVPDDWLE